MSSSRPYLLRALYQWILDDGHTPHVVVRAEGEHVRVPQAYVKDGQVTLNISPSAVRGLEITNATLQFSARFGGVPMAIDVPVANVLAVYARETGQGMVFGHEPGSPDDPVADGGASSATGSGSAGSSRPSLKVVK